MGPSNTDVGSASLASTTRTVSSTATITCSQRKMLEHLCAFASATLGCSIPATLASCTSCCAGAS